MQGDTEGKEKSWEAMEKTQNGDNNDQLHQPHIPHDIMSLEILSRLPIKSMCRFRAVCKLWCSVPDDPKFIELRRWRSLHAPHGIIMSYECAEDHGHALIAFYSIDISELGKVTKLMCTIPVDVDMYTMAPSLDGLVCFWALLTKSIYVCNPSTREFLQLPKVDSDEATLEVAGFGYDYYTGTYNVLCACVGAAYLVYKWFILSLGSVNDGWRQLDRVPHYRIEPRQNAYLNEVVYWVTKDGNGFGPDGLLSFDFFDRKFRVRALPNCHSWISYLESRKYHATMHLAVMGGQIRLITTLDRTKYWELSCWTLKDDIEFDWNFDFTFRIDILSQDMRWYIPVPVDSRDGQVYFSLGSKLYRHDLEKKITKEMSDGIPDEDDVEIIKYYQPNFSESSVKINCKHFHIDNGE